MFCFRCGTSMPDDAKVCPQCAAPVENAPPPPPPQDVPPPVPPSGWLNVPPAQPQYPPQAQYYPGQQPYGEPLRTDGKATASLVLGILSILCFGIFTGIPAIILGHISRGNIKRSMGRLTGGGMAMTGLILGYCSAAFSLLFIAAIVIPNLTRAKITANESAAASIVRTLNTNQVTYSTNYPQQGYAPDLASLGPGRNGMSACNNPGWPSAEHACLLDNVVGNYTCTAGSWCTKGGYKYTMAAEDNCEGTAGHEGGPHCNYVIVATPESSAMGRKSYCSTSDAVIRQKYEEVSQPISSEECSTWSPIA